MGIIRAFCTQKPTKVFPEDVTNAPYPLRVFLCLHLPCILSFGLFCSPSWVAIFQFLISLPLAVPAALVGNPSISPLELPRNLWNGWMCYLGYNSVVMGEHPDNCWPGGPLYVTLYLVANINFNILIIMVSGRRGGGGGRGRCPLFVAR